MNDTNETFNFSQNIKKQYLQSILVRVSTPIQAGQIKSKYSASILSQKYNNLQAHFNLSYLPYYIKLKQLRQQKKMKKNNIISNPDKKKLVIGNYKINLLQNKLEKRKTEDNLTPLDIQLNKEEPQQIQAKKRSYTNQNCPDSKLVPIHNQSTKRTFKRRVEKQQSISTLKIQQKLQRPKSVGPTNQTNQKSKKNFCFNKNAFKDKQYKIPQYISELYSILFQSCAIQEKNAYFITTKKQFFLQILNFILNVQFYNEDYQGISQNSAEYLRPMFQKLKSRLLDSIKQKKSQKLTMNTKTYQIRCCNSDYRKQLSDHHQNLQELLNRSCALEQNFTNRKKQFEMVTNLHNQRKVQILEMEKLHYSLKQEIQQKMKNRDLMEIQVQEKTKVMQKIKQEADKIFHYVQYQQEKKILHWVSEAYKQIESEIYQYATYLQCNSMACSLTWEPKPFRAVEKWVFEQMQRVNNFVICKAESNEDKAAKMKEFITNTTRKFRTKDDQMMKVTDFKTECINKFIKMMQKWMENWQLKQEYLVSLRNQFAHHILQANKLFDKCKDIENSSSELTSIINSLKTLWTNAQKNYKYGNSFY